MYGIGIYNSFFFFYSFTVSNVPGVLCVSGPHGLFCFTQRVNDTLRHNARQGFKILDSPPPAYAFGTSTLYFYTVKAMLIEF